MANWPIFFLYMIVSVGIAIWIYSFAESVDSILPGKEALRDQLWILIAIFVYQVVNGLRINRKGTEDRKHRYALRKYHEFKKKYSEMVDANCEYVVDADQCDDLTLLAIRYSPEKEKDVLNETLTLKNDVHQVKVLSGFVKNITGRLNLAPKLAANVRLAVEEAVVNVMDYAYPVGLEGDICICAKSDGKRLTFIISDEVAPFDPTKALHVDTTLAV